MRGQGKYRYFILVTAVCAFLAGCADSKESTGSEPSETATLEETVQETTALETGPAPETLPEKENGTKPGRPQVPAVTPVKDLNELLFPREEIQKVMVVIDRRGLDDITAIANEEEMNAVLDELYAADLSQFQDIEGEALGGAVLKYKLCTSDKEVNLELYQDMDGKSHYLKLYGQDRMPLAEIKGTSDNFDFVQLDQLSGTIRANTDDPLYSGTRTILETGDSIKLNKSHCGYLSYFFEKALKNQEEEADETAAFDVQIEIGEIVYQLEHETGYFSRQMADETVYGKLDQEGLFMITAEAAIQMKK